LESESESGEEEMYSASSILLVVPRICKGGRTADAREKSGTVHIDDVEALGTLVTF
jgi:hypothetical protein